MLSSRTLLCLKRILLYGTIVTLVSAAILRRKTPPAGRPATAMA